MKSGTPGVVVTSMDDEAMAVLTARFLVELVDRLCQIRVVFTYLDVELIAHFAFSTYAAVRESWRLLQGACFWDSVGRTRTENEVSAKG